MELTMDWIKKNWITIAVVVLIVAVIIYFLKKKKTTTAAKGGATKPSVKDQLAACEKTSQGIKMMAGAPHPCAALRDAAAKESGYFVQQAESNYDEGGNISDEINVVSYAMGLQGTSMLEENNFNLPSFELRPAAESNYNGLDAGAFQTTNGLNVGDFAAGNDGMALLMDANLQRK